MNNTEKKLDALIDALGFDVETVSVGNHEIFKATNLRPAIVQEIFNYKLTKRDEAFVSMSKERYLELLAGYEAWQNHE
jgi:hypothetical protein